jgi:hypothetical protein
VLYPSRQDQAGSNAGVAIAHNVVRLDSRKELHAVVVSKISSPCG